VKAHPARFVGIASVNLLRPMEGVRELRRAVKVLGLRGLRLLPWLYDLPPNDRRYYPLYAECIELGVPFCLQVGHTGPLAPSEPGRPIPYLDQVALDFPELVIVGGHIGYPWTVEMIALATKYPNVYIDTSAYKASRYPRELVDYMRAHGKKKVLFGSNFPMITPRRVPGRARCAGALGRDQGPLLGGQRAAGLRALTQRSTRCMWGFGGQEGPQRARVCESTRPSQLSRPRSW
jgi:predicted TIM-barrel fold metal-dependent hydrolase